MRNRGHKRGFRPSAADCVSVGLLGAAVVGAVADTLPSAAPWAFAASIYVVGSVARDAWVECVKKARGRGFG
jgi:hypothetical protein